jgi:hypothetical protein
VKNMFFILSQFVLKIKIYLLQTRRKRLIFTHSSSACGIKQPGNL